ncbi:MAG: phosphoglucosamine mutase [Paludibacteraceae bacterium]|nr:phosphoglucosamine mutase [Paludibacteraceae bacterium]
MTLIKSISGIRGTIGGKPGDGLNPLDIVKFTAAYATWNKRKYGAAGKIVVGRDARMSGPMVKDVVIGTLIGMGVDVVDIDLATTPTTELAVTNEKASGGIIITASHNPKHWNALKLLNKDGEFLDKQEGNDVLDIAEKEDFDFADVDSLGKVEHVDDYADKHVEMVKKLNLVDVDAIKKAGFKVVIDTVNSVGGIAIPKLLKAIGVDDVVVLNGEPTGNFSHNPEPIPQNLTEIAERMKKENADVGFVVDPDVDRLAIINEDGTMFGEEYTLVSVADYVLQHTKGNTASNLSSSRALRDVTRRYAGCEYSAAAVGEVNVVAQMKKTNCVIGGEGNGGVIYPELHYGRDALVGVALFLTLLAKSGKKTSELRATYPNYEISKNRIDLTADMDVDAILVAVKNKFSEDENNEINDIDGVKIDMPDGWVHLRKSNTEPIIRVYSEAATEARANELAESVIEQVKRIAEK